MSGAIVLDSGVNLNYTWNYGDAFPSLNYPNCEAVVVYDMTSLGFFPKIATISLKDQKSRNATVMFVT